MMYSINSDIDYCQLARRWHLICGIILVFFDSRNFLVECAPRPSLLHKERVQCTASIEPKSIVVNENTKYQTIWCNAVIDNSGNPKESFTQPAIDMSFGLSPLSGMFYLRGQSECSQQNGKCFSQFNISTQALRQLVGSSTAADENDSNSVTHHDRHANEPRITFTCNVADTSRNRSLGIRCSDTGSIQFTSVLKYGAKCSKANPLEQCGPNMRCGQSKTNADDYEERCVCKDQYWNYAVSRNEVICVHKADLGEKCNFTKQCTENNLESLCEFDSALGFKICKCLSGFEEVQDVEQPEKLKCSPIKAVPVYQGSTVAPGDGHGNSKVYHHKDISAAEKHFAIQATEAREVEGEANPDNINEIFSFGDKQQREQSFETLERSSQLRVEMGLIGFGVVMLVAVLILTIIFIRNRRYKRMTIERQHNKEKTFGGTGEKVDGNISATNGKQQLKGPLLAAIHKLSDDEEIDVQIDEDIGIIDDSNQNNLSFYSDQCDRNSHKSNESNLNVVMEPNPCKQSSQHSLNSLGNFSYSAKQSTV